MKFLDQLTGIQVRGRLPGIVHVVVMVPFDQVVNGLSHLFGVEYAVNFKDFFSIDDFWLSYTTLENWSMMWGQMGFVKHIILSFALPEGRYSETIGSLSHSSGDLERAELL